MKKYCYFNGKIVDAKKVGLPINDIGIIRGCTIFDYFKSYNGRPFRIKDYYSRFKNSADNIGLNVPVSQKKLEEIILTLLKKNKNENGAFRLILTGGPSSNNMRLEGKGNFYIISEDLPIIDPKYGETGATLITSEYQRQNPETKTTSYIQSVRLQGDLEKAGAKEILYHHKGKVLEGATSNIFIVKNKILMTPEENILHGVTRKVVIDLAKKKGIKVKEGPITLKQLYSANEVFITSSGKSIVLPIVKIDSKKIDNGKVGEITKLLMKEFKDYTDNY